MSKHIFPSLAIPFQFLAFNLRDVLIMADNPTIVALKRAKNHLYQILIYKGVHSPISALQIFVFFMVTLKFSARNLQYKFQFVVFSMSALTILCFQ